MNIPKLLVNRYGKLELVFRCIFYAKTVARTQRTQKQFASSKKVNSVRNILIKIYHSFLEGLTDISRYI